MFKLALIQMRVDGGRKLDNLARAEHLVRQATAAGARVVVLPEAMTLGWTHPSAQAEADGIPGSETVARLAGLARSTRSYLCSGLIERDGEKIFNSCVFFDSNGELLLRYRKINELELAHELYAIGDRLGVVDTPYGRFGLMICADGFARDQVIARTLGYMGAQIILSPSAWAVPADHDHAREPYGKLWVENYSPVAADFRMWIAGVSNVGWISSGPWKGRKCIGCSLVVDPNGRPVLWGPYGVDAETVLYIDIELEPRPARGTEWTPYWALPSPSPSSS